MECDAKELAKVLTRAREFLGTAGLNPVFKCFRFEGRFVEAADHDLAAKLDLPEGLDFKEPALVDGNDLQAMAAKLKGRATIEVVDKAMRIGDESGKFRVSVLAVGGFPVFPRLPEKWVPVPMISQAVKAVYPFAGKPESTQIYASVLVDDEQVVATDFSHGLGVARLPAKTGLRALMSLKLAGMLSDEEETELAGDERRLFVRSKAGVIHGPTVEGKYTDYRRILAGYHTPLKFVLKHADFKDAMAKISVMAKDGDITLAKFRAGDGKLVMECTREADHAAVELEARGEGRGEFFLNLQWIMAWFRATKCDDVTMSCDSGQTRVVRFDGHVNLPDGRNIEVSVFVAPMIPPAQEKPSEEKD